MAARIAGTASDATRAFEAAQALPWKPAARPRAILLAGMGGSAIAGDLLVDYAGDEMPAPFLVVRDYSLPGWAGPDCLFIASSYSGNTEETLSAYEDAARRGIPRVALCSGGRLQELALRDGTPCAGFPGGYQPRAAIGWSFFTLLGITIRLGLLGPRDREVAAAIGRIRESAERMGPEAPEVSNPAKQLARWLHGGFPVLYGAGRRLGAVALRWRTQLNENSKVFAHHHALPEQNHNEIVGWELPHAWLAQARIVGLSDRGDLSRVRARLEITGRILSEGGAAFQMVESVGDSLLERLFSLLVLGDWVSLYLGLLNGVDPTPVENINRLKSELERAGVP
jgi:glucose/mannose-6-phosphate isomerase